MHSIVRRVRIREREREREREKETETETRTQEIYLQLTFSNCVDENNIKKK